MEKVKVVLDWYPNNNHAGFFLADAKGLFKEAGLDIEIEGSANGFGEAGDADIMIASEPDILTMPACHLSLYADVLIVGISSISSDSSLMLAE